MTGTGLVTIAVSDGSLAASNTFAVVVVTGNTAPILSAIADQATSVGATVGPIQFQVSDAETSSSNLVVMAFSLDQSVIADSGIALGGSDSDRTITITPISGVTGTGAVIIAVSDGSLSSSNSFSVVITEPTGGPSTWTFTSSNGVSIPRRGISTPYPSTIQVSGVTGAIESVTLTLSGFAHTWPDDVDILLVSPSGTNVVVLSDVGGGAAVTNINLVLSDTAVSALPDSGPLQSGSYKPTNVGGRDSFPSPAPGGSYARGLSNFVGTAANGTWSLYVVDDGRGDSGSINSWSLTFGPPNVGAPPILTNDIGGLLGSAAKDPRVNVSGIDSNGCVVLAIEGVPSQKYRVEASVDLVSWATVTSLTLETTDATVNDCQQGAMRFYRLVEDWDDGSDAGATNPDVLGNVKPVSQALLH
jgi:subtilisin-like proprotein convertase family protein